MSESDDNFLTSLQKQHRNKLNHHTPAWTAVISLTLGVFSMVTSEFLPASLLPLIAKSLNVSAGIAGQTVTVTAAVAAVAAPLVVLFTARLNRQSVIWGLTLLIVLSNLLAALAPNVVILLLGRVGMGIALGGTWALAAAVVMRLVPPHLLARATALVFGGVAAATVCAPSLGAFLGDLLGWRAAFMLVTVLSIIALIIQLFSMPSLAPQSTQGLRAFGTLLRRRSILIGFVTVLLVFSGHFAGFTYLRLFLAQVPGPDIQTLSLMLLVFGIGGLLGNFAGGFIAEQSVRMSIVLASLLLCLATSLLLLYGTSIDVSFIACGLWGIAFGALPVGTQIWTTQSGADHAESAGALLVTITQIAIALGAITGGLLVDGPGIFSVMVYAVIAAFTGAITLFIGGKRA
ncbi:MFS transporter [Brenneria goodwinii]|uniref:MFS transporter n=1 Tax=Brenneria goodwinii TaxID=1109412 RepID=UPI0036E9811B